MGSSRDLNSLKSWNPKLSKNKESVKKLQERLIQREKDLQKDAKKREVEDLASIKKNSLSWMYETPVQQHYKSTNKEENNESDNPLKQDPKPKKIQKPNNKQKYDYSKDDPMANIKKTKKK